MSSFVICKREYVKAAGLVAGIAACKRDGIFIYDYEKHRRMTEKDILEKFVECFAMNALSVQMQYDDSEAETDDNDYMEEYKKAKTAGNMLFATCNRKELLTLLNDFFNSAIYQTEYEPYMWKMKLFFGAVLDEIIDALFPHECKAWGGIDLEELKKLYV